MHRFVSADSARLRSTAIELRDYLVRARASVDEEIRTYPTPIPRCDAQFNFVYEQRARLTDLLNRLNAELDRGDPSSQLAGVIAGFVASSPLCESPEERDLRNRLAADMPAYRPAVPSKPA
jgi:hypothetical protein